MLHSYESLCQNMAQYCNCRGNNTMSFVGGQRKHISRLGTQCSEASTSLVEGFPQNDRSLLIVYKWVALIYERERSAPCTILR